MRKRSIQSNATGLAIRAVDVNSESMQTLRGIFLCYGCICLCDAQILATERRTNEPEDEGVWHCVPTKYA